MRNFDATQQSQSVKTSAVDAVKSIFPVVGKIRTMQLDNVWVEEKADLNDYAAQAKTKTQEGTWGVPVYASLSLIENQSGKVVDKAPRIRLFLLPMVTDRSSYIVAGNEYQVNNQLRLKTGVYTVRKQNGELKTQVNLAKGKNFDLGFNEASGVFTLQKVGGGQTNIPLYPILTHLGISPSLIAQTWGSKLEAVNQRGDPKSVARAETAFGAQKAGLSEYFKKTEISSATTKMVLGTGYDKVDGPMLLACSKNLLEVQLGKKDAVDRDSLAFKELHSIEDFIKERLEKNKKDLAYKIQRQIDSLRRTKVTQIVNPGLFSGVVQSFFTQDDKSSTPEQTNPLEMLSGAYRASFMGSGGITSQHGIKDETRQIHPSHYGFIDPVHTPECYDEETEVFTREGWAYWKDVTPATGFACLIDDRLDFCSAEKLHQSHFKGEMYGVENGKLNYLVTANHRMLVRPLDSAPDSWRIETAEKTHGRPRTFRVSHKAYKGKQESVARLEHVKGSNASINIESVPIGDWCELWGWFLSEGSVSFNEANSAYFVRIHQNDAANPEKCRRIESLLDTLPWSWCQDKEKTTYTLSTKQLAWHFESQGTQERRFIPTELFDAPVSARQRMLDAMLLGDGRTYSNRPKGASYPQRVYCTSSPKLARDFDRLAISLGYSTTTACYEDRRKESYHDIFEIRILRSTVRSARKFNHRSGKSDYVKVDYDGRIYCATVPGGLLLVRRKGGVAFWCGNSDKIGVNLHLPMGVVKDGKDLRVQLDNAKSGKRELLTPVESWEKYVAFPGQTGDSLKVMHQGAIQTVPRSKVDFYTPSATMLFSPSTNLVPFLPANQGNRAMMASKMLEQAIGLKHREAPLVQVGVAPDVSMEQLVGKNIAAHAPDAGTVKKVTADGILLATAKGDVKVNLYNNFTLNRKSFLNHTALVKEGDTVAKDQLLAESNFTKDGTLALGINLRTAYIPYKGYNFEDGIVISQSASEKLTSEHIYKKTYEISKNSIMKLPSFRAFYPNAITAANAAKLDSDGVIKKGQRVKTGDVIIAALQKRNPDARIAVISKTLSERPKDASIYWTAEDEGTVTEVQRGTGSVSVFIKTEEAARIGDKLSGRMGNKGIITKILPDDQTPRDGSGKPVDILLNPHGVIGRINIGQIYESAAGKAALKNGAPYKVENFTGQNYLGTTRKFLKQSGVKDKEELFDPETGKSLGDVHVGNPYILKLFKQSAGNFSARQGGPGSTYDANMQPVKAGGEEGSKSLDLLTMYSMLSHGARANLQEMSTLKSNKNDEYWTALRGGQQLPPPKAPFIYDKFIAYLKGAGIDVTKDGTKSTLGPLTDSHALEMSSGAVQKPHFYHAKDFQPVKGGFFDTRTFQPVKGGFFDTRTFGGLAGKKWGHLDLKEPVVNPVFEDAARNLLGLAGKFDEVVGGKLFVQKDGSLTKGSAGGLTAGAGIERLLKNVDVDTQLESLTKKAAGFTGTKLNDANKKLRYLTALKTLNMKPHEAYIRRNVAVLPPIYRPVYPLPDGSMASSDVNTLYQKLGVVNSMMQLPVMSLLPEEEKANIRQDLYNHVKGVAGLMDVTTKGKVKDGLIAQIKGGTGGQPKEGLFISKLLSKQQDFVGRGTIIPEPSLGIDEMAMPEEMAWKLFEPFVVRELKSMGKNPLQAKEEIKKKSALAKRALQIVMSTRHVLLNRAPSLHKFSIMAFKPKITDGKALKIPPLIVKGFNADFNGDSIDITTIINVRYNKNELTQEPLWVYHSLVAGNLFEMVTGKTIDEMVAEARGFTAIYEIAGGRLQTMSMIDGSPEWTDVQRLTVHTSHGPCYEVLTHTGTRVITTEHHNFSYINEAFDLCCIKTEVMRPGVLLPKALPNIGSSNIQTLKISNVTHRLDEEMAWVLGFYAGDGSASDATVSFCDTDPVVMKHICGILRRRFNFGTKLQGTKLHKDCIARLYSKELCNWFTENCGAGFADVKIPTEIFNSPHAVRLAYVRGVFQAEGSVGPDAYGNYQARLEMCNFPYVESLRYLMSSVGLDAYLAECLHEGRQTGHLLRLRKSCMATLQPVLSKKQEKLAEAVRVKDSRRHRDGYDIVPFSKALLDEVVAIGHRHKSLSKTDKAAVAEWRAKNPGRKISAMDHFKGNQEFVSRHIAFDVIHTYGALASPYFLKWAGLVKDERLRWEQVLSITEVPRKEVMFDFTVPRGEMFLVQNGLFTHNTMTVHVPVGEEANKEAARLLPSRNLFQPGTGSLMIQPSQEAQIGLFYLSQTPAGRQKINALLPDKYKISAMLDKKATNTLTMALAKELPANQYGTIVAALKAEGEKHAFERGFTLGMDDIAQFGAMRDRIVDAADKAAKKAKTPEELMSINKRASSLIDKMIDHKLVGKDNPLYDMVQSGARGNSSQLRQIIASPLFMSDEKGRIVPTAIKKSYAEGLDIGDYWISMYGARRGMMDRAIQTSLPGAFSKDIMATTINNVVSMEDCGTHEGVTHKLDDKDVFDRYMAGDQGGYSHNTLVDTRVLSDLKKHGLLQVKVRSPLRCLAPKGTCAKCYGIDEHGGAPPVGDNIGSKAGQTMSEPLIQMVMRTFHTGGAAGTGADAQGYARVNQLLQMPKIVVGAAPLAAKDGKVSKITKGLGGGFDVTLEGSVYHVPAGKPLKVSVGSRVAIGDPLSEGVVKPQDLVKLKGMDAAQDYIASELQKSYAGQGIHLHRKIFETVVRSLGNTTQVQNNPKDTAYLPGDIIPYTVAQDYNRNLEVTKTPDDAVGYKLSKATEGMREGHTVTQADADVMRARGIKELTIKKDPLIHAPLLKSLKTLPLLSKDWMGSLGYQQLQKALTLGAGQGWSTDTSGYHPIPAFAQGVAFGKGKDGKY
jgi:DNA-directed RNA polymerase beta subunit